MGLECIFLYRIILMISAYLTSSHSYNLILKRGLHSYTKNLKLNHKTELQMSGNIRSSSTVAKLLECDSEGINASAAVLKAGGLVAFPTETVYGLGANALNDTGVKSIFAAKKRPSTDPLIVHVLSKQNIYDLFEFEDVIEGESRVVSKAQLVCEYLAETFWPGPLTIIFKAKTAVPMSVTAGTGFVGVRSPRHPIARQLLEAAGLPIAAPSANRFGHVSPTSAEHVMYDLGEEEIIVLKDNLSISGGCAVGIESTVCRVSKEGDIVSILRCGAVTSEDVSAALSKSGNEKLKNISVVIENEKALIKKHSSSSSKEHSSSTSSSLKETVNDTDTDAVFGAVAPGQMIKHYAPDIPTFVVSLKADPVSGSNVSLNPNPNSYRNTEELTCVDSSSATVIKVNEAFVIDFGGQLEYMSSACSIYCDLSPNEQPEEACNRIFEVLRQAETSSLTSSAIGSNSTNPTPKVVLLPDLRAAAEKSEMVRALWERLHRAASGTFVC